MRNYIFKQLQSKRPSKACKKEDFPGKGYKDVIWGFPKIRGTLLGVPIIRTVVFGGLYWVTLILGNYHIGLRVEGLGFRV